LALKSTTAISEILGIVPTSSSSSMASGSGTPSDKLTSPSDELTLGSLTTSTKSVADYFRDKLLFKSSAKTGTAPVALRSECEAEAHDAPRSGLGSSRPNPDKPRFSISSVPAPQESSVSKPTSEIISIECQEPIASKDISLEKTSSSTKKKGKGKTLRTDAIHLDSESSVGQTNLEQKQTKSDKKNRKVKKRSRDNDENC
jgi:Pin2-interacting protein X1